MNEIKSYDLAAHKFYTSLKINSLPIISWDIHATSFHKMCANYSDITHLTRISENNQWSYTEKFDEALLEKEQVIVVTDSQLNIVYATQNIYKMNGYRPEEVIGNKPKIFQGKETCMETSKSIRKAIKNEMPFEAKLINYRKDGSTYNCWIKGQPVFNKIGEVVNFIAYEREVA